MYKRQGGETYICGNPPYLGSKLLDENQKSDLKAAISKKVAKWKSLDLITGWFLKAAQYLKFTDGEAAFVTTNSINQGQPVSILWPEIFELSVEISFAYPSFRWDI